MKNIALYLIMVSRGSSDPTPFDEVLSEADEYLLTEGDENIIIE
jgi:hypothetical protein